MELHPGISSFATSAVAKVRIITGTKECFRYFFYSMFGQEKKLLEKFRFKFMDAYIHIRVNLNSHECLCDKNVVYNGMYIYMGKLKP